MILLLILAQGLFAGAEIAIIAMRRTRIQQLVKESRRGARAIETLRDDPERFIATVQVGITVLAATASALGGSHLAGKIEPYFANLVFLSAYAKQLALLVIVGAVSIVTLIIGELIPKSLALRRAEPYALMVSQALWMTAWLMRPLVWFLTKASNLVLGIFGDRTNFTESKFSRDELRQIVTEAAETGSLDPRSGEIAARALDFGQLFAKDMMVPRQKVVMLPRKASAAEIQRVLLEEGHSRIPVFDGSVDNIVGYVTAKDILGIAWQGNLLVLEDLLRPVFFVPETMRAVDLLQELQKRHISIALVVDEQGGMAGLLSMEDLVEELVGEIFSENDELPPQAIVKQSDGSVLLQGSASIRDVNRDLELNLPESESFSTIAGLCIALAGRIPHVGEKFKTEEGSVLEIVDASVRRVRTVRIHNSVTQQDFKEL